MMVWLIYISDYITETTEVIEIYNLKVINSKIAIENNREILLSALYRSHDISKTKLLSNIKKLIKHNSKYKTNLIMGDFNFDILNQDTINQEFLQILLEQGYCSGFSNITRPSDKTYISGTRIDNIFIKLDEIAYKTFTLRVPLTDNFPLFMSINKIRNFKITETMNHINYTKFKSFAASMDWSELSQMNDPNTTLNNIIDEVKICLSKAEYI